MLLIVEGAPKTGKSTLSRLLAEDTGWPVVSFGDRAPGASHHIVDQLHLTTSLEDAQSFFLFDEIFMAEGAFLILLVDSPIEATARINHALLRLETPVSRADVARLQQRYTELFHQSRITPKLSLSLSTLCSYEENRWQRTRNYERLLRAVKAASENHV